MNISEYTAEVQKTIIDLYRSDIYALHNSIMQMSPEEKHFTFEITKRFLDVCRILNIIAPNTILYAKAVMGEEFLKDIYENTLFYCNSDEIKVIKDAVHESLISFLKNTSEIFLLELFTYEQLILNGSKFKVFYTNNPKSETNSNKIVCSFNYDIYNFFQTLDYYRKTNAPLVLIKSIIREPKQIEVVHFE